MAVVYGQIGLATISAGVQRAGGTRQHPGSALDEALELRAASIEGGASGESIAMGTTLCPFLLVLMPSYPISQSLYAHSVLFCSTYLFSDLPFLRHQSDNKGEEGYTGTGAINACTTYWHALSWLIKPHDKNLCFAIYTLPSVLYCAMQRQHAHAVCPAMLRVDCGRDVQVLSV